MIMTRQPDPATQNVEGTRPCVSSLDDEIVHLQDLTKQSAFTVLVVREAINDLTKGLSRFALVVDLSGSEMPSASVWQAFREILLTHPAMVHTAIYADNATIRTVAELVLTQGMRKGWSYSICGSRDDAKGKARAALQPAAPGH